MFGNFFPTFFQDPLLQASSGASASTAVSNTESIPPASSRILNRLPEVIITKADLDEDETHNLECSICLNEQRIGRKALKLPCGHLFCRDCVLPWLRRRCSCPVCRFELETDDPLYEPLRKQRMRHFRFRFRRQELLALQASALKELALSLGADVSGCLEKRDFVQAIASKASVVEGAEQVYKRGELLRMSGGELKNLLTSFGVDVLGLNEKNDLIDALNFSRRVLVIDDTETSSSTTTSSSSSTTTPTTTPTTEELSKMKVSELRTMLAERKIEEVFIEKADMVKALSRTR